MTSERCPSCGGAVRPGSPWCTLCWADLRPAPAPPPSPSPSPPPPPAAPAPVVAAPYAAPVLTAPGAVDPLTAPLAAVLGGPAPAQAAQPLAGQAADPAAEQAPVEWPCVECGTKNSIDLDTCRVCTAPFGGRILRLDDVREVRRKYMLMALGAVGVFLLLLAALTFAGTDTSSLETGPPERVVVEDPFAPTG